MVIIKWCQPLTLQTFYGISNLTPHFLVTHLEGNKSSMVYDTNYILSRTLTELEREEEKSLADITLISKANDYVF